MGAIKRKQQQNWNLSQPNSVRSQRSKFNKTVFEHWMLKPGGCKKNERKPWKIAVFQQLVFSIRDL